MITLFYILIILGLSHCDDLLSRIEVESSINRTINEVERLIHQNSTLPHLSRREIVDILVNITSKDLEAYKDKRKIEEARKIYQRALMVVLPYNAEDSEESMKDLYTKPPIVEIIADHFHNQENYEAWKTAKLQSNKPTQHDEESIKNLVVTHTSERTVSEENPPEKIRYKNHKETYTEMNMNVKENLKFDSAPVKFSFNLENLGKPMITKEPITTTKHPVFVKSTEDEDVDIIYSTSVTTVRPVETSPKSASTNSKESQTLFRPLKYNENVLSADLWHYHAPTNVPQSPMTSAKIPSFFKIANKRPFSSIATLLSEDIMAPTIINKIENTSGRETSKITSEEMEDVEETTPIYVTPMSPSPSPFFSSEKSNYNSTYNLNLGGFRKITTTTTTTMRPEVMELIASIGLRPENTMHIEKVFEKNKENFQNKSQVLDSNGLIYTTTSGLTAGEPDSLSIAGQNTFEGSVSELGKGINNLTPDIRVLFQRFGLQTSNLVTTTPKPMSTSERIVNTNSYTNFKILPTSSVKDQEMKEFLAKFGLGIDSRHKKAMPASTERSSLIEAVPDNMRSILENIGLISRKTAPKVEKVAPMKISKFHVFKPHEVKIKDEKQKMQINELLDTIRLVQEGKASAYDVRKAANDLLVSTKTLKDGPDPLSLEEIIAIYNNDVKNEVKRQQGGDSQNTVETVTSSGQDLANNTTAPTESMDVPSTTSSTTTTTMTSDSAKDNSDFSVTLISEEEKEREKESSTSADANLVALQESFGGTTRAPDPTLPKKPKSGLYFLVDWNTFLEVGDENAEKVNLRFQPKVGDRSRFLPVTVP